MDGSTCIITDIPDVLLIEIISYLNASERVQLARCGEKFHSLVFEDRELLKYLDFSNEAGGTSASDVYEYFKSENTSKHIVKVNLRNVNFNGYHKDLLGWVSTAVNLVDIDIHGIWIRDKGALETFLKPLPHVKRLSFDWSWKSIEIDRSVSLRERFEKLTYLSLVLWEVHVFNVLYEALKFCGDLKKLRIIVAGRRLWLSTPIRFIKLKKLESVEFYGPRPGDAAEFFVSSLLHQNEWTHFDISNPQYDLDGFYLERNVEVCEKLLETKSLNTLSYRYPNFASQLNGMVVSTCLLEKVMQLSQGHLPEKFCCFTLNNNPMIVQSAIPYASWSSGLWLLNIEETKRLLKDPAYKISYLRIAHNIEQECDAHRVTSEFPNLTELVIANIVRNETTPKTMEKRLQPDERSEPSDRAVLGEPDESLNPESSFSKLVEGTPYLRNLTIIANTRAYHVRDFTKPKMTWDLAALTLIPRWKNLTTIRLRNIPIIDGEFLVEIGKQCKHLETVELCELAPENTSCYTNELLQMLTYCSNLKDLILQQRGIERLSEIFLLLGNNPELRKVCVENAHDDKTDTDLGPSIEHLLCHCLKLTTFKCLMEMCQTASDKLKSTLERLKGELKRPTFQFQVGYGCTQNSDQDPLYLPVYNFCGHSSA